MTSRNWLMKWMSREFRSTIFIHKLVSHFPISRDFHISSWTLDWLRIKILIFKFYIFLVLKYWITDYLQCKNVTLNYRLTHKTKLCSSKSVIFVFVFNGSSRLLNTPRIRMFSSWTTKYLINVTVTAFRAIFFFHSKMKEMKIIYEP